MQTNEELVQKAVITAADALATDGKLNPVQADKFIDYVVQETIGTDNMRVVKFSGESMLIDKIGLGTRNAMPASEAVDPGLRRGVNTSKVTITPQEIMTPFEIGDTFREVNVELDNVNDHIVQMMARATANDTEEAGFNGDLLGPAISQSEYTGAGSTTDVVKDGLWALFNGWFRAVDSDVDAGHVYTLAGTNIGSAVFSAMIRQLPTKWRRNLADLRWYMSPDLLQLYFEKLATRGTTYGDQVIQQGATGPVVIFGIKPVPVPLFPLYPKIVQHVALPGTTAVALRYKPIIQDPAEIVVPYTLDSTPTTPYVEGTDYNMDYTNGTIARDAGGVIGDGDTVKVTYYAYPQILLTHRSNLIFGMSRDVRIEKDRDIFRRLDQYAITTKVDYKLEEADACVKGTNIGIGV